MKHSPFGLLLAAMISSPMVVASDVELAIPDFVAPGHRAAIQEWMATHGGYRVATDVDCMCPNDIASLRAGGSGVWAPQPNFHPYYASGDFNGDGAEDFAVVLIRKEKAQERLLLIFNGPFGGEHRAAPAYLSRKYAMPLFYGPPRPKPYRLVAGTFESEGAAIFEPSGKTYRLRLER